MSTCSQRATTLETIEGLMQGQLARVPLGDMGGFTFEPPSDADWFVVYPAGATAGAFDVSPALRAYAPVAPPELVGAAEPGMAFLKNGKVVAKRELLPAYTVTKVLAKTGGSSHGLRFVRLVGTRRNYNILQID